MRKTALRTVGVIVALLLLSVPHATKPQSCSDDSARTLLAGSVADALINPPNQEDNLFFTSQGGYPNIYFLLDTGTSMARLPPNGPASLGALPATGLVGCGGGVAEGSLGDSGMLAALPSRVYHSPCGVTPQDNNAFVAGNPATGGGADYGVVPSQLCPYYTQGGNALAFGIGYDPDFPDLFPRDEVFHDSATDAGTWTRTGANPGDHDFGNGWAFVGGAPVVAPYEYVTGVTGGGKVNSAAASIAQFCADQGTTVQGSLTRAQICNTCLTNKGWYYDGEVRSGTVDGVANVQYPSIWYTGNYLSFFPPKFVVARKVVKDIIANQTRIRMAIAQFGASGYVPAGSAGSFNPSCSSIFNNGNWESNRSTYVNAVNALTWGGSKPLSTALFDVGFYYHTPSLPWFDYDWSLAGSLSAANTLAVCWSCQTSSVILLTDGLPDPGEGNTLPPGTASIASSDSGKYAGDPTTGVLGTVAADCPRCGDFTGTDGYKNNLTKVAFYLHNYDLRSEGAGACGGSGGTLDGQGMPGKQTLDVYTVGFATANNPDASRMLANAANAGGGLFVNADSAEALRAGVFKAFTEINERSTSFSVATVSTLQTTTGHSVIIPRFDPAREPHWPGHLYRYELYSEFVNPCTPNGVGDLDCDGACGSVFLMDKDKKFIAEDGNGHFVQTGSLPSCEQTPRCVAQSKPCGTLSNVPANPWWDAYETLKQQAWRQRSVWTVVDDIAPFGTIDGSDSMIRLDPNDTATQAIQPYLGLGTTGGVCATIARKIETAGDAVTAQVVRTSKRECAKTIIRFVLGADVLNEVGRTEAEGWPPPRPFPSLPPTVGSATVAANLPNQDLLLDRKFKLGDIYHSSPVVVDAPLPADGILCPNGLHNQCMESLWRTPVKPVVTGTNQYDLYAKSAAYKNRRKMILVGSNDGMLHAFNGGQWHANLNDPATDLDESKAPFEGYYDRGEFDADAGRSQPGPVELWAFIPPDLLGKLPFLLTGEHQILVDGTAMVRDVWVDGVGNGGITTPAPIVDDMKAASEFHTVAIVGERRGGTHFFALDVSDAAQLSGGTWVKPKFLWIYPQPSEPESLRFGETYTEFLPVPPPIGPVRIKADPNSGRVADANTPTMAVPGVATPVPYHERWVTLLPGGFDPQLLRGRGVHMVDVWTGKEVFDFSYPTTASAGDPRLALTFPVAAMPGMVVWGTSERRPSLSWENDGYFDTATFGDLGGQLWVLRFNTPGEMDTDKRVQNWFGARVFQMGDPYNDGSLCNKSGGQPFFYITANTALPGAHVFRVYAGTGDRFNLIDTNGGICGPDNLRACAQKGCSVTLATASNGYAATGLGMDARGLTQAACSSTAQSNFTVSTDLTGAAPTCGVHSDAYVTVAGCPNVVSGNSGFVKDVAVTCDTDAGGAYGCRAGRAANRTTGVPDPGSALDLSTANSTWSTYPMARNWYFSLKVFDDTGNRAIFKTAAQAALYDQARLYVSDSVTSVNPLTSSRTSSSGISLIDGSLDNPTGLASATSQGWAIYYKHGPTITTDAHTYNVNLLDERTSSVSGLYGKVLWNTIQPALGEATAATNGCATSKCTAAFRRLSYHYAADAVTGGSVFQDSNGNPLRSIVQNTLVPAQGDQPTVFVNQKGQIAVGLTAVNPEKGASNLGMGGAMDPVMGLGVVEVTRDMHACRHAPSGPTDAPPPASACK